jgi:hypothetical protein
MSHLRQPADWWCRRCFALAYGRRQWGQFITALHLGSKKNFITRFLKSLTSIKNRDAASSIA